VRKVCLVNGYIRLPGFTDSKSGNNSRSGLFAVHSSAVDQDRLCRQTTNRESTSTVHDYTSQQYINKTVSGMVDVYKLVTKLRLGEIVVSKATRKSLLSVVSVAMATDDPVSMLILRRLVIDSVVTVSA